jgi:hypothetical protein
MHPHNHAIPLQTLANSLVLLPLNPRRHVLVGLCFVLRRLLLWFLQSIQQQETQYLRDSQVASGRGGAGGSGVGRGGRGGGRGGRAMATQIEAPPGLFYVSKFSWPASKMQRCANRELTETCTSVINWFLRAERELWGLLGNQWAMQPLWRNVWCSRVSNGGPRTLAKALLELEAALDMEAFEPAWFEKEEPHPNEQPLGRGDKRVRRKVVEIPMPLPVVPEPPKDPLQISAQHAARHSGQGEKFYKMLEEKFAEASKEVGEELLLRKLADEVRRVVKRTQLQDWLLENLRRPYPTDQDKLKLCEQTGMRFENLTRFFISIRQRIWVVVLNNPTSCFDTIEDTGNTKEDEEDAVTLADIAVLEHKAVYSEVTTQYPSMVAHFGSAIGWYDAQEEETVARRPYPAQKSAPEPPAPPPELSEYEKARLERIAQNKAMLAQLGLDARPLMAAAPRAPRPAPVPEIKNSPENASEQGKQDIAANLDNYEQPRRSTREVAARAAAAAVAEPEVVKQEKPTGRAASIKAKEPENKVQPRNYIAHVKSARTDGLFCPFCNKQFTSQLGLTYHVQRMVCQKGSGDGLDEFKRPPPVKIEWLNELTSKHPQSAHLDHLIELPLSCLAQ